MTLRDWSVNYLTRKGLWPEEARTVVDGFAGSESARPMGGRWGEDASAYPEVMLNVLSLSLDAEAVLWIDANKPQHWARGMFVHPQGKT